MNAVAPGPTATDLSLNGKTEEQIAGMGHVHRLGRLCPHGCCQVAVGGVFCDATSQEFSKRSCAKLRYRLGTSMDCK